MMGESSLPSIDGVVFDLDGTLVDTLPLHYMAYESTFSEIGITLSEQRFYRSIGGTASEAIPLFLNGRTTPIPVEEIHRRKKERFSRLLDQAAAIPILEPAKLLEVFKARVPMAVATSGSRAGLDRILDRLGWAEYFSATVSGDDVIHGKPHPEPYLTIADALQVDPDALLAFEDSDAGVASAAAAGLGVFDVRQMTMLRTL